MDDKTGIMTEPMFDKMAEDKTAGYSSESHCSVQYQCLTSGRHWTLWSWQPAMGLGRTVQPAGTT